MRRLLNAALSACVFVCALNWTSVAQDSSQGDATRIIALEHAWSRASETKDTKSVNNLLDDNFVYVDVSGKMMTKAEVLKDITGSGVLQVVTKSMMARLHGNTAVITGTFRMEGIVAGKPLQQQGRFVDTWLFKKGVWVCVASQATGVAQ
jgi:ketosteroid isomerase-like protein